MKDQLIECVPNFSEGNDLNVIRRITDEIEKVEGVRLLDVDPGKATNRTVVTFVGSPEPTLEAAFQAVKQASELIDMRKHKGEHPRFGATDVCPLIPISNIEMEQTAAYARSLGKRIGEELGIPVYCYENAAFCEERRNLAAVRSGEYEGLKEKLENPEWKPDFGPASLNEKSGAIAVGARDFLVAYNVNLNTTSTRRANAIAFDIREKGRIKRAGNKLTGEIVRDAQGKPVWTPGSLKAVKAIGWYIEEYGITQVSINLTNISVTPVHMAFDEACQKADARGIRVTGSELVGLIPLKAMLDAGRYFLRKQKRSTGVSDAELIKIAVRSLGLNDLSPFNPNEKIIEYVLRGSGKKRLVDLNLEEFMNETASESPAPGGGSISAYVGSLGAALATMVANLSSHKRGWDERWEDYSDWAEKAKSIQNQLLHLVDEDTEAFQQLMAAFRLPGKSEEDKAAKVHAIREATKHAAQVPLQVMQTALGAFEIIEAMAQTGLSSSVSDAGVAALAIRSCILGAFLNVKINVSDLDDGSFQKEILETGRRIENRAVEAEAEILKIVDQKIK